MNIREEARRGRNKRERKKAPFPPSSLSSLCPYTIGPNALRRPSTISTAAISSFLTIFLQIATAGAGGKGKPERRALSSSLLKRTLLQ